MDNRYQTRAELDQLEFLFNAPPLPKGCTCASALTETPGLLTLAWDCRCTVHGAADEEPA